jgi:hypothetical protein
MDLLTIVNTEKIIPVKEAIHSALQGLTPDEQLSKLIDFFQVATERDVQLTEVISEAWDYLDVNSLWNTRYSSLEALKQDIDYDYALRHILDRHQANVGRRKGEMHTILDNWRRSPEIALPSDLRPPIFGDKILRYLATLSRICTLNAAIPLLHLSVQARRSTPGHPKHKYLLRGDVLNVVKSLRAKSKLRMPKTSSQLQVKTQVASQRLEDGHKENERFSTLPARVAADDKETDQQDVNMEDDGSVSDNQDNRLAVEAPGTLLTGVPWCVRHALDVDTSGMLSCCCKPGFSSKLSTDTQPHSEHASVPTMGKSYLRTQSRVTRSVTRLQGQTCDLIDNDENGDGKDDGDINGKNNGGSDSENDDDNDHASYGAVPLRVAHRKSRLDCCSCPVDVKKLISNIGVPLEVPHQSVALANLREMAPFKSLCRNHLRLFAGNSLGMVTNIKTAALQKRLEWIYPRKRHMVDVRRVRPFWFRGQSGDVWRVTPPVFVERDNFQFDAVQVSNTIVIGCQSGRVLTINFSFNKSPLNYSS